MLKYSKIIFNIYIIKKIKIYLNKKKISCKSVHLISETTDLFPKTVGSIIKLIKIKVNKCQLELFNNKETTKKNNNFITVYPSLKFVILNYEINGLISCKNAWLISKNKCFTKAQVAFTCKSIKIKICKCQLGLF